MLQLQLLLSNCRTLWGNYLQLIDIKEENDIMEIL